MLCRCDNINNKCAGNPSGLPVLYYPTFGRPPFYADSTYNNSEETLYKILIEILIENIVTRGGLWYNEAVRRYVLCIEYTLFVILK